MTHSSNIVHNPLTDHFDELSQYTLQLKEKIEQANIADNDYQHKFAYSIGNYNLILPEYQAAEIISPPTLCTIPNTPTWFKGMVNLRGNLIPVFDLALLFENNPSNLYDWLIVFGEGRRMAALCISDLPYNIKLEVECDFTQEQFHQDMLPFIKKAYLDGEKILIEPDYETIFNLFHDRF